MKTIAEEWEHFWATVYSDNTNKRQLQEMQTAFYAGAFCLLNFLLTLDLDELDEEAGAHAIETMRVNIVEWITADLERRIKEYGEDKTDNKNKGTLH